MITFLLIAYPLAIVALGCLVAIARVQRSRTEHQLRISESRRRADLDVYRQQQRGDRMRLSRAKKLHDQDIHRARADVKVANRERELYRELRMGTLRALGVTPEETVKGSLIVERRDDQLIITWSEFLRGETGTRYWIPGPDGDNHPARRQVQRIYRPDGDPVEVQSPEATGVLVQ